VNIAELDLPAPLVRRLADNDIATVDDLAALTYNDVRDIRWVGRVRVAQIETALAGVGRQLKGGL
jgi:hypothetical protein